MDDGDRRNT